MYFDNSYKHLPQTLVFKYTNLGERPYFELDFPSIQSCKQQKTNFSTSLNIEHTLVQPSKVYETFYYSSMYFWNELTIGAKNAKSIDAFKQ